VLGNRSGIVDRAEPFLPAVANEPARLAATRVEMSNPTRVWNSVENIWIEVCLL
jgi:hypothetical protein